MLAAQRRTAIVSMLDSAGAVSVSELASRFEVSDMTIRRDLDGLSAEGLIAKVHGGAVTPAAHAIGSRRTEEPGFHAKSDQMLPEKQAIAKAAAELVEPGMSIGLSAGTTTWTLAQHLLQIPELTVVTNSPRIADVFHGVTDARIRESRGGTAADSFASAVDQTVILTGGVRTPSDALIGPIANQALRSLHLDLIFLGAHGFTIQAGFTTPNLEEAETNRTWLQTAPRAVVLADHSKFGTTALGTFAGLPQIHMLITDTGLPAAAAAELGESIDSVVRTEPRSHR